MKRYAGVAKRPGSAIWQWSQKVPDDLRQQYPTQWAHRCSLKTSDLREANELASRLHADWLDRFSAKRRELNPQRIEIVTPELSRMLAQRVAANLLRTDDIIRSNPSTARLFLDTLRPFGALPGSLFIGGIAPTASRIGQHASFGPLDGLSIELAEELAQVNEGMNRHAATQMALQRIAAVLPLVKAEAQALGLDFDEKAPGALDALRESLRAYRRAIQDIAKRDVGEVIETPQAPIQTTMNPEKPSKLRDLLPQWKASKARKPATVKAAEKALSLYEAATGNPPIGTLTRSQGVDMRAFLLAGGVTAKTARDRFDYIKGFLNFASVELEVLDRNPWSGLKIEYTTTSPRRPWSGEQLQEYFSRPLHAAYDIPTAWDAGADAAYWVPLMGIFTGARISELCQLNVADIETIDGVNVIHVTDQGEGQAVKSKAGRRMVPVHAELVRLGFLEYAAAVRKVGALPLFPSIRRAKDKAGSYFSQWFSSTRTRPDGSALPDFHSLRHTVRSKLASAGIAEPLIDMLIGHEIKGSTGARKYTDRTLEDLQRAMASLSYPGLKFARVFVSPVALNARRPRLKATQ
jgi:integrase